MTVTEPRYLSISGGKCREGEWLILAGRVHGSAQIYLPLSLNDGCSILARQWVGSHVEVVVNDSFTYVSTLRLKKKTGLAINVPWRFRKIINGLDIVHVKIRPIADGDGYGGAGS
jgi:hypothetical protein